MRRVFHSMESLNGPIGAALELMPVVIFSAFVLAGAAIVVLILS